MNVFNFLFVKVLQSVCDSYITNCKGDYDIYINFKEYIKIADTVNFVPPFFCDYQYKFFFKFSSI